MPYVRNRYQHSSFTSQAHTTPACHHHVSHTHHSIQARGVRLALILHATTLYCMRSCMSRQVSSSLIKSHSVSIPGHLVHLKPPTHSMHGHSVAHPDKRTTTRTDSSQTTSQSAPGPSTQSGHPNTSPFTSQQLRAYIAMAKQHDPKLPESLTQHVCLLSTRRCGQEVRDHRLHSYTSRECCFLILRLAQALAKLRFDNEVRLR
jgi:hypothetical protein